MRSLFSHLTACKCESSHGKPPESEPDPFVQDIFSILNPHAVSLAENLGYKNLFDKITAFTCYLSLSLNYNQCAAIVHMTGLF